MRVSFRRLCLTFIVSSTWVGCADHPFRVEHLTPDARFGRHISVFAIERDGLMNRAGWNGVRPRAQSAVRRTPLRDRIRRPAVL